MKIDTHRKAVLTSATWPVGLQSGKGGPCIVQMCGSCMRNMARRACKFFEFLQAHAQRADCQQVDRIQSRCTSPWPTTAQAPAHLQHRLGWCLASSGWIFHVAELHPCRVGPQATAGCRTIHAHERPCQLLASALTVQPGHRTRPQWAATAQIMCAGASPCDLLCASRWQICVRLAQQAQLWRCMPAWGSLQRLPAAG